MIHYIVACHFGERRYSISDDGSLILRKHLNVLSEMMQGITRVTVVLNFDTEDDIHKAHEVVNDFSHLPLSLICRENRGYSYAAWDQAVRESIEENEIEFYALFEDDYVPSKPLFYNPFIEKFKNDDRIGYVCSMILDGPRHAAMSIGLLKKSVAKSLVERTGKVFDIVDEPGYVGAENTQRTFLTNMELQGYLFDEAGKEFCWPFCSFGEMIYAGNELGEELITPIMEI